MLPTDGITIAGVGLLGGSIGLGLRAAGYKGEIVGLGHRAASLDEALRLGCIDRGELDLAPAVAHAGLIVLATPLSAFPKLLQGLGRSRTRPGVVITDVGSTKAAVCADAARWLAPGQAFVGSHPMAGSERQGPAHADAGLFKRRPCVVTPGPETDAAALARVKGLWTALGMRLITMTPAEHDARAARISHLPHAVAALLVQQADRHGDWPMASTGFRDTTRVAGGDPTIWRDIFATNRDAVTEALDGLSAALTEFRELVRSGDDDALRALLERSRAAREAWIESLEQPSYPPTKALDKPHV